MSAHDQLQYLGWALYIVIFLVLLQRALHRPTPAHIDMTLFFGAATLIIVISTLSSAVGSAIQVWLVSDLSGALLMSLGYLLLRLVRDFSHVPQWIVNTSVLGLLVSVLAIFLLPPPITGWPALLLIAYFLGVIGYDTWAFAAEAGRSVGVTRRRMQAVAAGSLCIGLVVLVAGLGLALPAWTAVWTELMPMISLASGIFYLIGFTPPTWLRRAWQEPELRQFLSRAASLARMPEMRAMIEELERGAAAAVGAPSAGLGIWDADRQRLRFFFQPPALPGEDVAALQIERPDQAPPSIRFEDGFWEVDPSAQPISGRAFLTQRSGLVTDVRRTDPGNAELYRRYNARSALVAPVTAGDKRLGVLIIFAPRAPVFANADLEVVQLLADQAAVVLESRALLEEAARVRAREEATRLKDDFLSSAAHDLKTPLTGIVTQAQLLQRRAERNPDAPVDRAGLRRLLEQSLRLRDLVLELLDVSRLERGSLIGERTLVDLGRLVAGLVEHEQQTWQRIKLTLEPDVLVRVDVVRTEQVVTNLIENALKYSSNDDVQVQVWREAGQARLCVKDRGIGIPLQDQPLIFERFHRARNVDDRRFAGMGLGLYISRGIVDQHGGRIWVDSVPGAGSTFHVALPLAEQQAAPNGLDERCRPGDA